MIKLHELRHHRSEAKHFLFHQINAGIIFVFVKSFTKSAESPVADRLLGKMVCMKGILKTNIKKNTLFQIVLRKTEKRPEYQSANDKIDRGIWTRGCVSAVQNTEPFFVDRRIYMSEKSLAHEFSSIFFSRSDRFTNLLSNDSCSPFLGSLIRKDMRSLLAFADIIISQFEGQCKRVGTFDTCIINENVQPCHLHID